MGDVSTLLSAWVMTRVPQKANAVLDEPVLLLMARVSVLVSIVPGVQELQVLPPVSVAPTNSRSLEVQELADGKVVVVCAKATSPTTKKYKRKKTDLGNKLKRFLLCSHCWPGKAKCFESEVVTLLIIVVFRL
jgi:hypothetical protein